MTKTDMKPIAEKKTEMYKCQSYCDDDGILQNCTCGRCTILPTTPKTNGWESDIRSKISPWNCSQGYSKDDLLNDISQAILSAEERAHELGRKEAIEYYEHKISEAKAEERKRCLEALPKKKEAANGIVDKNDPDYIYNSYNEGFNDCIDQSTKALSTLKK